MGVFAALIDMAVDWLSDLKNGFCTSTFWLSYHMCCREFESSNGVACDNWNTWSESLGFQADSNGGFLLDYLFFIIAAVIYSLVTSDSKDELRWSRCIVRQSI